MLRFAQLLLAHPIRSLNFTYSFVVHVVFECLNRIFMPHVPRYQSFRTRIQRAYWASCSTYFPTLLHRLPVVNCPASRARRIGSSEWTSYIIPGTKSLESVAAQPGAIVAVYAHGGGYARGEARMYLNYMERWERKAVEYGLDITFVSVEYPLTDVAQHPAQEDAFLNTYEYVLSQGVPPSQVIFMGDSAGGGCCLLSSIKLKAQGRPLPAASVLISPWFDMALKSFEGGCAFVETDYIITANEGVPLFAQRWIGKLSGNSPEINPLYCEPGDLRSLPPPLILAGGGDFVLPECQHLVTRMVDAGLRHKFIVEWGEIHLYALGSKWIDARVRARTDAIIFEWIAEFIKFAGGVRGSTGTVVT